MAGPPHPYRIAERREPTARRASVDPIGVALWLVGYFVLGWACLRVAVATVRGLDFEALVALVLLVGGIAIMTRSFA